MTACPENAVVEAHVAEGVALWDVSRLMPRGPHQRATKRPAGFVLPLRLFLHNSGALGMPGIEGARRATDFVVRHRGFPGAPYHFWAPYHPLRDEDGRLVLLRLAGDHVRTWSQGAKANDLGASFAFQGNTSKLALSPSQVQLAEAFAPWASERYALPWPSIDEWLSTHSRAGSWGGRSKSTCPGLDAERWLRGYLARATAAAA